MAHLAQTFEDLKWRYVFQEETGDQGTKHLQGFILAPQPVRFNMITSIHKKISWRVAKDWLRSKQYCTKIKTRTGDVFTNIPNLEFVERPKIKLRGWQEEVVALIDNEPDDRTIHWYWGADGCEGKSTFALWCALTYHRVKVCSSGRGSDVKHYVSKGSPPKIMIFDLTRTQERYVSYQSLEEIKNGQVFSGKYDSDSIIFKKPHVFVFANFPPEESAVSRDRWHIVNIAECGR